MKNLKIMKILPSILLFIVFLAKPALSTDNFLQCLSQQFNDFSSISGDIYTPINSSYSSILKSSIKNLRFASSSTPKPLAIITPENENQIPPLILCAKQTGLQIRTRSGGHDFEGLSYASPLPFVIIDLIKISEITIDVASKTAWVGSGATIGALYCRIAEKSNTLGFPAGSYATVGVGGQFSGGGVGPMQRKYGVAADNVIDARIVDVNGRILDRESMGEDLFWAIRGGGGSSFGIIVAWKIQLVDVPENVVVFKIQRSLEQRARDLIYLWQNIAPYLPPDLFIEIHVTRKNSTVDVSFFSLYLGETNRLLILMRHRLPQLGLKKEDCKTMTWIQSILFAAGFPIDSPIQILLNRTNPPNYDFFKGKSNFATGQISKEGISGMLTRISAAAAEAEPAMVLTPFGGRMDEISETEIPFAHRAGTKCLIYHQVTWREEDDSNSGKFIEWSREFDDYLTPYVSSYPREAYLNYRDLDLGVNRIDGKTTFMEARVWGLRYFRYNYDRLVWIKYNVDPENFFRDEQSLPAVLPWSAE